MKLDKPDNYNDLPDENKRKIAGLIAIGNELSLKGFDVNQIGVNLKDENDTGIVTVLLGSLPVYEIDINTGLIFEINNYEKGMQFGVKEDGDTFVLVP